MKNTQCKLIGLMIEGIFFLLWLLITLSTYVNYTRCIVVGLMIEQQKILSIVTNNFYITHVKVDKVDRTDD